MQIGPGLGKESALLAIWQHTTCKLALFPVSDGRGSGCMSREVITSYFPERYPRAFHFVRPLGWDHGFDDLQVDGVKRVYPDAFLFCLNVARLRDSRFLSALLLEFGLLGASLSPTSGPGVSRLGL